MNIFKIIYCRLYQSILRFLKLFIKYKQPTVFYHIEDIKMILANNNLKKPLIICGKNLLKSGQINSITNVTDCFIFSNVKPNPDSDIVYQAFYAYKSNRCDCVISIGGGSSIDCGKATIALLANTNKDLYQLKGLLKVVRKTVPFIAISTTAGSGSEATIASVIVDSKTKEKYVISDYRLIPSYVILDYKLTFSLSSYQTVYCGIDALTHSLEAYLGKAINNHYKQIAKQAIKDILTYLPIAFNNPKDHQAREKLLLASFNSGIVFTNCYVGYVHAISHSLSGKYDIPHGKTNAIILPIVLKSYGSSINKKIKELLVYLNFVDDSFPIEKAADYFIEYLNKLNNSYGIENKIYQLKEDDIDYLAQQADKEANPLYPVIKLQDKNQLKKIYYQLLA